MLVILRPAGGRVEVLGSADMEGHALKARQRHRLKEQPHDLSYNCSRMEKFRSAENLSQDADGASKVTAQPSRALNVPRQYGSR